MSVYGVHLLGEEFGMGGGRIFSRFQFNNFQTS